ncbi:hypothetical protein CRYUN_Cryun26dG0004600 [Craigia yunnanensis]
MSLRSSEAINSADRVGGRLVLSNDRPDYSFWNLAYNRFLGIWLKDISIVWSKKGDWKLGRRDCMGSVHHDKPVGTILHQSISVEAQMDIGIARTQDTWHPPYLFLRFSVNARIEFPHFTLVAIKSIETELGIPVSEIFSDIKPRAYCSSIFRAAHLHSREVVAVKVQRPGMSLLLTLDALLFHMIGGQLKRFAKAHKDLLVAVNEMVRHMFDEIDYILEARIAERFASLYGGYPSTEQTCNQNAKDGNTIKKNAKGIKVPKINWDLTRKAVFTMEWVDGIKLTDETALKKASLNRRELIDQGVYCSLRQLLEVGFFHADPHPGNLVATSSGSIAYFDFGMMGDIPLHYHVGLIQGLIHFVNRDSLGLADDFLSLGFIPEGVDIQSVEDALQASLGDGTRQSQDFQSIMSQLYDVMYDFNFSLPPDYALVVRALGSLEGTAKALDPDFKVVESAYPFVIGRLLADPNPDMRKFLRELLIRNNGSIRWNRLECMVAAISEQASEASKEPPNPEENGWMQKVKRGKLQNLRKQESGRVESFVVMLILTHWVSSPHLKYNDAIITRVVNGFRSVHQAVKLAPEVWTVMFIRIALKPETHSFSLDMLSILIMHIGNKFSESFWVCMSRLIHKLAKKPWT